MKHSENINPSLEMLTKYFGDNPLLKIPAKYIDIKFSIKDIGFENNFISLLNDYNLNSHSDDLFTIGYLYIQGWENALLWHKEIQDKNKVTIKDELNKLNELREFLGDNSKGLEISFKSPTDSIKVSKPISELIAKLILNSPDLRGDLKEFIILNKYGFLGSLPQSMWGDPLIINSKEIFDRKNSIFREFSDSLYKLFSFLQNETLLKSEDKIKSIRFIIDFTKLVGIDWNLITSDPKPEKYLEKHFQKIVKSKIL